MVVSESISLMDSKSEGDVWTVTGFFALGSSWLSNEEGKRTKLYLFIVYVWIYDLLLVSPKCCQ